MSTSAMTAPHRLVGQSPEIRQVRAQIEKAGRSRSPVLILGETGTGKEVVAQSIHAAAPRGSFVPIDCGSLVGPLMESELFGHIRGAFTGAHESKKGLIEAANGGTAFFDEIGDLPLELQVKLLRVLQESEYRPVGSLQRHRVDIRIIAATHRDLKDEVRRGRFREDLYFRLNVMTLRIPPLRDRRDDIPLLIEHFLRIGGERHTVSYETKRALIEYAWPGNVRELSNCVQRMTAMADGAVIVPSDLPSAIHNRMEERAWEQHVEPAPRAMAAAVGVPAPAFLAPFTPLPPAPPSPMPPAPDSIEPLAVVERAHILRAVDLTRGDRTAAAALLGIGRTTLYRKLKEYGYAD